MTYQIMLEIEQQFLTNLRLNRHLMEHFKRVASQDATQELYQASKPGK
jgi:hypothetical protein